jgi:hypothetical protein
VLRFGAGVFYNRFSEGFTLTTHHNNGVNISQYIFTESTKVGVPTAAATAGVLNQFRCADGSFTPDCISVIPTFSTTSGTQQSTWTVVPNLKIPTIYVVGGQVERQLPHNFTVSVGTYAVRILHVIRARDINAPLPDGTRPIAGVGEINQFEGSGKVHQEQLFVGFNSRLNPQFSLSGNYVLSKTANDTDGQGGSLFPMNSYDLSGEFGRGGGDVRHRFFLFGTYNSKLWKLVFAPFVTASSAPPFNIITGLDANQDRVANERPSFAALSTYCTNFPTRCAGIHLNGNTSDQIIPRNLGQATGSFVANLRITRTFGFGDVHKAGAANRSGKPNTASAGGDKRGGGPGGPGSRGPMIAGAGGGEGHGGGGGGMGGMMGGGGSGGASDKKYQLTVSLYVQNILNTVNLGNYEGNLSSPLFGQPKSVAGSFGGFGGGGGGSPNAGNRRIYMNLRFNF